MDALYQGASTALVLVGIGIVLLGIAVLWRAVGHVRTEQGQLSLDQAAAEQSAERFHAKADDNRQRMALFQTLLPAATAAIGHWLGSQSDRHGREEYPFLVPRYCEHTPPPGSPCRAPEAKSHDDTHVEVDLESLFELLHGSGLGDLLASMKQAQSSADSTTPSEPAPDTANAAAA